jgi:hypothetical protein
MSSSVIGVRRPKMYSSRSSKQMTVGPSVGRGVGGEGARVGRGVGRRVGRGIGLGVGRRVGLGVGFAVGDSVGTTGAGDGSGVAVGPGVMVGMPDGLDDGEAVGSRGMLMLILIPCSPRSYSWNACWESEFSCAVAATCSQSPSREAICSNASSSTLFRSNLCLSVDSTCPRRPAAKMNPSHTRSLRFCLGLDAIVILMNQKSFVDCSKWTFSVTVHKFDKVVSKYERLYF